MRVVDLTNQRTGYTYPRRFPGGSADYSYYVRWHDGTVDRWGSVKKIIEWRPLEKLRRAA